MSGSGVASVADNAAAGFNGLAATGAPSDDVGRPAPGLRPYRVVLADIEGATTDIAFVHDVLFPFARERVAAFLADRRDDADVAAVVQALREQSDADAAAIARGETPAGVPAKAVEDFKAVADDNAHESVVAFVHWQMNHDRKSGALKRLQGLIWAAGYADGSLKGHVYADFLPALYYWLAVGVPVAIYSSGSVLAQKLLFGHSEYGNLLPLLVAHYDTAVGGKLEADSYTRILERMRGGDFAGTASPSAASWDDLQAADVLFVSDNPGELRAAHAAGMQVALAVRPGNPLVTDEALREWSVQFRVFSQLLSPEAHHAAVARRDGKGKKREHDENNEEADHGEKRPKTE